MVNNINAMDANLALCSHCHQLNKLNMAIDQNSQAICSRCHSPINFRKPRSIEKTWALTIASVILLFPANLIPITTVIELGSGEPDTIMSGIISLYQNRYYLIAFLIFVASIVVPVIKVIGLMYLLISIKKKSSLTAMQRIWLYRFIEWIGRWSMLDIYVLSVLMVMVNAGVIADVRAEPGANYFLAVIILTMFAAKSFDTRLIWQDNKQS